MHCHVTTIKTTDIRIITYYQGLIDTMYCHIITMKKKQTPGCMLFHTLSHKHKQGNARRHLLINTMQKKTLICEEFMIITIKRHLIP